MNIFKKLTTRNLKLNKKRTITTIIGIMLSTALICATFGLTTSFQQSLLNDSIKQMEIIMLHSKIFHKSNKNI